MLYQLHGLEALKKITRNSSFFAERDTASNQGFMMFGS
jgi:hypothetical protein